MMVLAFGMFLKCFKLCGNLYGYVGVFNEAKRIYIVFLSSKKIHKNLGGRSYHIDVQDQS